MDNMLNIILVMMVFHLQHILSDQKTIYNNTIACSLEGKSMAHKSMAIMSGP